MFLVCGFFSDFFGFFLNNHESWLPHWAKSSWVFCCNCWSLANQLKNIPPGIYPAAWLCLTQCPINGMWKGCTSQQRLKERQLPSRFLWSSSTWKQGVCEPWSRITQKCYAMLSCGSAQASNRHNWGQKCFEAFGTRPFFGQMFLYEWEFSKRNDPNFWLSHIVQVLGKISLSKCFGQNPTESRIIAETKSRYCIYTFGVASYFLSWFAWHVHSVGFAAVRRRKLDPCWSIPFTLLANSSCENLQHFMNIKCTVHQVKSLNFLWDGRRKNNSIHACLMFFCQWNEKNRFQSEVSSQGRWPGRTH